MAEESDITLADGEEHEPPPPAPTLRILFEADNGIVDLPAIPLRKGESIIGRASEPGGVRLDDAKASRRHARIRTARRGLEVVIEDISSNGTFVNGARITEAQLSDGDVIRIGDSFLHFRYQPQGLEDAEVVGLLGDAPSLVRMRRAIARVAPTDATVLVTGASGTGKEVVARALHEESGRKGAFVPVNCSAIPETLAESQLFGHVAGSFTGARKDHRGHFQEAEGGTLFLDELGELPLTMQPKLLRVLEEHVVTPVGASHGRKIDVRVIAATNRDLQEAVADERFRGDLYARIAEITLTMPPLCLRREDILGLLELGLGTDAPPLDAKLVETLLLHSWPYNVREVLKVAKQLRIDGVDEDRLRLPLVAERLDPVGRRDSVDSAAPAGPSAPEEPTVVLGSGRDEPPTREEFVALLTEKGGNVSQLAKALSRSRRQVYRYLEMYELDLDDYR